MAAPAQEPTVALKSDFDVPVVLITGFMAPTEERELYWGEASRQAVLRTLIPVVSPVASSWERACQLFYQLKGGRVDYGEAHSRRHEIERFGPTFQALYPEWDEDHPVHLVGHSFGGCTARALQQMLADGCFSGHTTSSRWVLSISAISTPLNGALAVYSLGAKPEVLTSWLHHRHDDLPDVPSTVPSLLQRFDPTAEPDPPSGPSSLALEPLDPLPRIPAPRRGFCPHHMPVRWFSLGFLLGCFVHLIEFIDARWSRAVYNFHLDHFRLSLSHRGWLDGVGAIAAAVSPWGPGSTLFQTDNNAPYDLTLHGAHRWNRRVHHFGDTYYFSYVGDSFRQRPEARLQERASCCSRAVGPLVRSCFRTLFDTLGGTCCFCRCRVARDVDRTIPPLRALTTIDHLAAVASRIPSLPIPLLRDGQSWGALAKEWFLWLMWQVVLWTEWTPWHFEHIIPGFDPGTWLRYGHDGLCSVMTQIAPLHYREARGAAPIAFLPPIHRGPPPLLLPEDDSRQDSSAAEVDADALQLADALLAAPQRENLPFALRQVRPGVWYTVRTGVNHVGLVPSPDALATQRAFVHHLVACLASVELMWRAQRRVRAFSQPLLHDTRPGR